MDVAQDKNHAAEAQALLPMQYKSKANVSGVLAAFSSGVQSLENALYGLWYGLLIANAVGQALDQWGKLLNAPRAGWTDAEYRVVLNTKIATYKSHGRTKDVIAVARIALGDANLTYTESTTSGHFTVQKDGADGALIAVTALALHEAKPVGVGGLLVYSTGTPATTLHWGYPGADLSPLQTEWSDHPYGSTIDATWAGATAL